MSPINSDRNLIIPNKIEQSKNNNTNNDKNYKNNKLQMEL